MHRRAFLVALLASLAPLAGCAAEGSDAPTATTVESSPARRSELILEGGGRAASAATRLIVERAGAAPMLCIVTTASEGEGHPDARFRRVPGLRLRLLDIRPGQGDAPEAAGGF